VDRWSHEECSGLEDDSFVLCGVFGENVIQDALKTRRGCSRKFFIIFFLCFTLGQLVGSCPTCN
jgi:hypothetical protein